jgi:hypothetical protein
MAEESKSEEPLPQPEATVKQPKAKVKKTVIRDENGNRLTKSGAIDKRKGNKENLMKSRVYQRIIEEKKKSGGGIQSRQQIVEVDSSTDDEDVEVKPVYQPKPQVKPQPKDKPPRKAPQPVTEYYHEPAPQYHQPPPPPRLSQHDMAMELYNQIHRHPGNVYHNEVDRLKEENRRLRQDVQYSNHLNRISHMSSVAYR